MWINNDWKDYAVLAAGDGMKLERWKDVVLLRPDPQAIWPMDERMLKNTDVHAAYRRSSTGGGEWQFYKKLPPAWSMRYKNLAFTVRPTGFKHTGLFPEQAANWDFAADRIAAAKHPVTVLNLFAYTGAATLACAAAGAKVVHVDAAKGMVAWAKENAKLSGLEKAPIRYIVDDCLAFVAREQRRGNRYQGIIMDPPSYGRGPTGQIWKVEEDLYTLALECSKLLADDALFMIVNSYTTGLSAPVLENILTLTAAHRRTGRVSAQPLALPIQNSKLVLPCGVTGRWQAGR